MAETRLPTDAELAHIKKHEPPLLGLMNLYGIHPQVRSEMSQNGFTTMDMVSAAYPSEEEVIDSVAKDFKFEPGDLRDPSPPAPHQVDYTNITSKAERTKFILLWNTCVHHRQQKIAILSIKSTPHQLQGLVSSGPLVSGQAA